MPCHDAPMDIAVIGTGIAGMSAAWLLSGKHRVTIYEQAERLGGHCHTVDVPGPDGPVAVDTGFIVYNEHTYPNLTALFRCLDVATLASDMSFSVSLRDGDLEYAGTDLRGLFAQKSNLVRPRFWHMLADLQRFYREAPREIAMLAETGISLRDYLATRGYGSAFTDDHLLPMAAAIWSTPSQTIGYLPAASFIRFCQNHGLLQVRNRPVWRTVAGGSRCYVKKLTAAYADNVRLGCGVRAVRRLPDRVMVSEGRGKEAWFDHVVIATHPDQALSLLPDWSADEAALLGAFRYGRNTAVLHTDTAFMPRRRNVWSSWNYLGSDNVQGPAVTYWMNRLQGLRTQGPLLLSLNPPRPPDAARVLHTQVYEHPMLDAATAVAQRHLWKLQGVRRTWFCGAWFGAGFHEDGLQSGLAVAEQLGGVRRPWIVPNESGRIYVTAAAPLMEQAA